MNLPTKPLLRNRILVVEEDDATREDIARALEIEGYTVIPAQDASVGLEILSGSQPDLILADIELPGLNGLNFYQAVRRHQQWVTIPLIFLASQATPEDIHYLRGLAVEDYLVRPVDPRDLVRVVHARLLRAAELQIAMIDHAYLETVTVLANTIEGRDPYTKGHVERVTTYARWLAEGLHWPEEHLRTLEFGARLHDIGKIIIPDHILNKPGGLDEDEWKLMKEHPRAGARILHNIQHLRATIPFVLHHHERWNGSGYPQGLREREIPLEGRLLAIADVYDALTTARPYHPARLHSEVIEYLRLQAGVHFDPDLTEIFIQVVEEQAANPARQPASSPEAHSPP